MEYGRVSPTITRVVDGKTQESLTKTRSGERTLALDPATREALRVYMHTWAEERRQLDQDINLLFVWPHGASLHPDTPSPGSFTGTVALPGSHGSSFTTSVTPARPRR